VLAGLAQSVAKRPGYPSGKWHPEVELSQGLRRRLAYLWHQKRARTRILLSVALLLICWLWVSVPLWPRNLHPKALGFTNFLANVTNAMVGIAFAVALTRWLFKLLRSGRVVEGLIVGHSDDGIDRLYTVYYEDGPSAYEGQFTAKLGSPASRLKPGDSITLIVGPGEPLAPQQVIFCLPASECSPPK
jgi:hypothetical protein